MDQRTQLALAILVIITLPVTIPIAVACIYILAIVCVYISTVNPWDLIEGVNVFLEKMSFFDFV